MKIDLDAWFDETMRRYTAIHHPLTGRAFESQENKDIVKIIDLIQEIRTLREVIQKKDEILYRLLTDASICDDKGEWARLSKQMVLKSTNEALAIGRENK